MTSRKKGYIFSGKGNCEKCTGMKQRRKRRAKRVYCKIKMPIIFIKGSCVETPLYTMCLAGRMVIRDELRTGGGAGGGGGGGPKRRKGVKARSVLEGVI